MLKTIVAVFLIVIGGAVRAEAQDAARTASELGTVARYGDRIWLLDIDGREVRGLFYKISGLDVEVSVTRRGPLAWSESEIRRIRRRVDDSLRNGARNGFIVGGALGLIGPVFAEDARSGHRAVVDRPARQPGHVVRHRDRWADDASTGDL
jgi:hypothetical protein